MIDLRYSIISLLLLLVVGCAYGPLQGKVVDAETGEPIEGAVVYVEWRTQEGLPGLSYHRTYADKETITNKHGKFWLFGVLNPCVEEPIVIVYKKGYTAWRSKFIFPDYRQRTDFVWKSGYVFRLEKFKKTYSHSRHIVFFAADLSLGSSSKLERAYSWERALAEAEDEVYNKKLRILRSKSPTATIDNSELWRQVVQELNVSKEE